MKSHGIQRFARSGWSSPVFSLAVLSLVLFSLGVLSGAGRAWADAAPSIKLAPALTHIPVKQGQTATDLFKVSVGPNFKGKATLTITGLPSFVTASWSSNPIAIASGSGSSILSLTPSMTAKSNWYTFSVTASGDGASVTQVYTVEVKPAVGVAVGLSLPAVTVQPGSSTTVVVTATPKNGVTIPAGAAGASSATSGLPSFISASWSKPSIVSGAVAWTVTLTAAKTAPTGDYSINLAEQITDNDGGLTYSASQPLPVLVSLLANASIGETPIGTIAPNFMGLSHEPNTVLTIMGDSDTGQNNVYRQLLTNLITYGSGPVNVRIGGNSADTSGEQTAATLKPIKQVAESGKARFTLAVNLGADNVNLAVDQAKTFVGQMPPGSLTAIEIGNEPDEYYRNGLRPSSYTIQDYYADFNTWASSITPFLPSGIKLAGPSWAFLGTLSNTAAFQSQFADDLALFSTHCYGESPQDLPTTLYFLSEKAAKSVPSQVASSVATTHANGIIFRLNETGPVSDGGVAGVSNSFASALWAIDTMFEFANVGVDGVDWSANPGDLNNPFVFNVSKVNGINNFSLKSVTPIYYGFLVLELALGDGAQMLPVTLDTPANLKAWATIPNGRAPRITLINKDVALTGNVGIEMPGYSKATILRLAAPSYNSVNRVTFAGQTFDGSSTGYIQGTQVEETIEGSGGTFSVPMPVTSAAVVIFSN